MCVRTTSLALVPVPEEVDELLLVGEDGPEEQLHVRFVKFALRYRRQQILFGRLRSEKDSAYAYMYSYICTRCYYRVEPSLSVASTHILASHVHLVEGGDVILGDGDQQLMDVAEVDRGAAAARETRH